MAIDRRKTKRFIVVDLDLHDSQINQSVGRVANISDGGLFAIADRAYTVGETCSFHIPIGEGEEEPVVVPFKAWVIWSHPNRLHPDKYSLGLEFIEGPDINTFKELLDAA